jgi:hypothetical protein
VTAANLLDRLDAVRQVGAGRWRARCPAHDGQNKDVLSIGEASDGTVLVKCFHGCTASDVVKAVGLELADLFPKVEWQGENGHHVRPRRPRVDWPALILACERDLLLAHVALADVAGNKPLTPDDRVACKAASTRVYRLIQEARHG